MLFPLPFYVKAVTHGGILRGFPSFARIMGYLSPFLVTIVIAMILSDKLKEKVINTYSRFQTFLFTGMVT